MMTKFNKGDIYKYQFAHKNLKYCIIISNGLSKNNRNVIALPISDEEDTINDYIEFEMNDCKYYILYEKTYTVDSKKLLNYIGRLDDLTVRNIDRKLATYLNINIDNNELLATEFLNRLDNCMVSILSKSNSTTATIDLSDIENKVDSLQNENKMYNDKITTILQTLSGLYSTINTDETKLKNSGKALLSVNNIKYNNDEKLNVALCNKKIYETAYHDTPILHNRGEGKKRSLYAEKFDYSIENALHFIDEWNTTSNEALCKKYSLTRKQLNTRKYSICKYLVSEGIKFEIVEKRGRN